MQVDYTITYLEMTGRPAYSRPAIPLKTLGLLRVTHPPVHLFLYLYSTVGAAYHWTDLLAWEEQRLASFVQDEKVALFMALDSGAPAGFFQLDTRQEGVCDIAYFGLLPEFTGAGRGRWLLGNAIHTGWDSGPQKMTVNTCTLDHPAALPLYQKMGFKPVRQEQKSWESRPQ